MRVSSMRTKKPRFNVVITDSEWPDGKLEQEILEKIGASVKHFQTYDTQGLKEITRAADGILVDYGNINEEVITNLTRARLIVSCGVGYDNIDVNAATQKGVLVCNVPDFMTFEVADHTIALVLAMIRKITWADQLVRTGDWSKHGTLAWRELQPLGHMDDMTAGIVGFGRIGRQVAERLHSFHMKIVASDPYVPKQIAAKQHVELLDLKTLLKKSDVVCLNTLLSKETYHLIGEKELRSMKPTAIIVNTSRGRVIDQTALVQALRRRTIAGAALDVLESEPPSNNDEILTLQNVIFTPHIGGVSERSSINLRKFAAEEIRRVLSGQQPKHPVNPSVLTKPH